MISVAGSISHTQTWQSNKTPEVPLAVIPFLYRKILLLIAGALPFEGKHGHGPLEENAPHSVRATRWSEYMVDGFIIPLICHLYVHNK